MSDSWIRKGHPVLFSLTVFFAVVDASLATWLTAKFNQHHNQISNTVRDRVRYLVFVAWWTVLFCALYVLLFFHSSSGSVLTSVASYAIFLFFTWIFWLAGVAAITQGLHGGYDCSTIDFEVVYCNQLNAVMGFAWVCWAFITIAMIAVVIRAFTARRRGDGFSGQLVD